MARLRRRAGASWPDCRRQQAEKRLALPLLLRPIAARVRGSFSVHLH